MRDIKFRIWNIDLKCFDYVNIIGICRALSSPLDCKHIFPPIGVPQQYTGLKDKNNKDIYEGDIVLKRCLCCNNLEFNRSDVVIFDTGSFKLKSDIEMKCNHKFAFDYQLYEVIGNIYENPELLNE
jgi:hypothetical protein